MQPESTVFKFQIIPRIHSHGVSFGTEAAGCRLQAARLKFHESHTRGQNVSDISYECGFTHLGRFAEQYRRWCGDLPSETLKKQS
ncbi:MAG: helix-turn-helix domain-containing protein [Desulfobulbia bacterium]